jgi:hypothetical protein
MRGLIVFLVALGLGSLTTVVGQEPQEGSALEREVERLTRMLTERSERLRAEWPETAVDQRFYEVGDFLSPVVDSRLRETNLIPSKFQTPERDEDQFWRGSQSVDWLIEVIRQTVEPESWDTIEGADIQPRGPRLIITTSARVHRGIEELLARLVAFLDAYVAVEIVAIPAEGETVGLLLKRARDLGKEEARKLLDGEILGRLEVVCTDGQQVVQRSGTRHYYLQDYEVEIAQGSEIGDPVRRDVFSGFSAQVRAILDRGRNGAVLHLKLERTDLRGALRMVQTEHGALELPEMGLTRVNTSFWAPLDTTVIVGGGMAHDEPCVFLATARRLRSAVESR